MRRALADDEAGLKARLEQEGITQVCVVSPHLDDAAFSLAEFLTRSGLPPRFVFTVFTRAGPMTPTDHSLAMGFADTEAEFRSRREEDMAAMLRLGIDFAHFGLEAGRLDSASAHALLGGVLSRLEADCPLILLPLGAGATLSGFARMRRRVLRMPEGCSVHGDHVWVRDQLRHAIAPTVARLGYYAEIPYQWANTQTELEAKARYLAAGPVDVFALMPDLDAKLAVVQDYASQVEGEFGRTPGYRRRTAGIAERIFLPAQMASAA